MPALWPSAQTDPSQAGGIYLRGGLRVWSMIPFPLRPKLPITEWLCLASPQRSCP